MRRETLEYLFTQYCGEKNLTVGTACIQFGITRQFLNLIFQRKSPCPEQLVIQFAKAFKIPLGKMMLLCGWYSDKWEGAVEKDFDGAFEVMEDFIKDKKKVKTFQRMKIYGK